MDQMNQKPNFKIMSDRELKSYVLSHRDDDEAFYAGQLHVFCINCT